MANAELGHEFHILLEAMVVVAGDIAGVAIAYAPGGLAECIPDAGFAPVDGGSPFDLIG